MKITLNPARSAGTINKNIFGHFSEHLGRCIYQGMFVGKDSPIPNKNGMRTDVVEALKNIQVPVLRWPGGCFADEYHWKDGIGPQEGRKRMVNTHWGGVVEDNSFGTHEFFELCEQIGCEPYVAGNLGSGTVQELAEWIEYMTFDGVSPMADLRRKNGKEKPWRMKYLGIGNESWGCGGNMRPEYYADEYRRYQTYCRNFSGNELFKVACGPNSSDYNWTETIMPLIKDYAKAISMHYYTLPTDNWGDKGSATGFDAEMYYKTLCHTYRMEEMIKGHLAVMDKYDPEHKVGLIVDEWGTWYNVEPGTNPGFLYQQNTMRDAMVAAINLNIFMAHCDRVCMANLAQTVNVLQSVILTEGDKMVLTPTYHVFDLYKAHQDAQQVDCLVQTDEVGEDQWKVPQVIASASQKGGKLTLTIANMAMDKEAEVEIEGVCLCKAQGRILQGEASQYNDFDNSPLAVKPFDGIEGSKVKLPACCVVELTIG